MQGTGKLETQQVVVFQVSDPDRTCAKGARGVAKPINGIDRSAGNLEGNRTGLGQSPANHNQGAPGRHIHRSGKLQRFPAITLASADEDRDRELQPRPFALLPC